jgi:hypothetical protein
LINNAKNVSPVKLDPQTMPEAEVSLRLAIYFAGHPDVSEQISVAIDGAQVKVNQRIIFPLADFMHDYGWGKVAGTDWKGKYQKPGCAQIEVHSTPGKGDVVATIKGKIFRIESKKGPLERSRSSQEYPLIREAIGQLMTVEEVGENDILGVVVPDSPKFRQLAAKWRVAPLIKKFGIKILLVNRDNQVSGF